MLEMFQILHFTNYRHFYYVLYWVKSQSVLKDVSKQDYIFIFPSITRETKYTLHFKIANDVKACPFFHSISRVAFNSRTSL